MGAGSYVPVGYYFDWNDAVNYGAGTINAKLFQQLGLVVTNFSIAKKVNPRFSLGGGLELIYGNIEYKANKAVVNSGIPFGDYTWNYKSDCDGIGLEGIFGILFKATDKLSFGSVYRTGSSIELKGKADTNLSLAGLVENSDFKQEFHHPSSWGLGLAYTPKPKLSLTIDWQRTNWSEFKIDVDYNTEGVALIDKNYSADWKDSNRYRLGVEYRPTKNWVLRGGYFFDESPLPDKSVSFSNIADLDRHNLTLGAGYQWKNGWQFDFLYAYSWGDRKTNGVDYSQKINGFGIQVTRKI